MHFLYYYYTIYSTISHEQILFFIHILTVTLQVSLFHWEVGFVPRAVIVPWGPQHLYCVQWERTLYCHKYVHLNSK